MARRDGDRAVSTGLLALAGVGLVVGLLVSAAVLAATQVLGLGGEDGSGSAEPAASRQSMYLPTPSPTATDTGPAITLAPVPAPGAAAGDGGVDTEAPAPTPTAAVTPAITLTSSVTEVGSMQEIPLTGAYPGGEGATLQVERLSGDTWTEFPVDTQVRGEAFSTYIRTGQSGATQFRVRDVASGLTSNEVTVTIS